MNLNIINNWEKKYFGFFSSTKEDSSLEAPYIVELIDEIANSKGVTKAQVALAWILIQNNEIVTIPGTRKINRLEENLGALNVDLTENDLAIIEAHSPSSTVGERY